jgi:hypothetical protein
VAIAYVNGFCSSTAGSATTVASSAQNHTAGNTVIVFVSNYTSGGFKTISGIADTAGNTYTKCGGDWGGDANQNNICYVATNITGNASNVVTVTFATAATYRVLAVLQYSGLATSDVYDAANTGSVVAGSNSGAPTTWTGNSVTTSADDQIVLGFWTAWDSPRVLATSGSNTLRVESGAGGLGDDCAVTERIAATAGSYAPVVQETDANTSESYANIARSFKAAGGGSIVPRAMLLGVG